MIPNRSIYPVARVHWALVWFCGLVVLCVVSPSRLDAQYAPPGGAPTVQVKPPMAIFGLPDAQPMNMLEFSRAWLGKAAQVRQRRAELQAAGRLSGVTLPELAAAGAALTGTLRVPVIPVRYADGPIPFSERVLEQRLFGAARGDTVTLSSYYDEISSGLLRIEGEVTPWIQLSHEAQHYLPREQYGWAQFGRVQELWKEVIEQADALIDFGRFDNDGRDGRPNSGDDDGFVDFVIILVATRCDDWRAGSIWPHRGAMPPFQTRSRSVNGDNIKITDYVVLPAMEHGTCRPLHVGLLAHEIGHAFGLPDLYDYDGSTQGVGAWDIMGTGSHSAPHSPTHMGAWSKEQLGWVRVEHVGPSAGELSVPPVVDEPVVYRHDLPGRRGEYLLMENRRRRGSDRWAPGEGLLVWRIDPERSELGVWDADARGRGVSIIEADSRRGLLRGGTADAGGTFPGSSNVTELTLGTSRPFRLSNIRESLGGAIEADVEVGYRTPALVAATDSVWLTALPGGNVSKTVAVGRQAGASWIWAPESSAPWLTVRRSGESLLVQADADGLAPGLYRENVTLTDPDLGAQAGELVVSLRVAAYGAPEVVSTAAPWSWGLAVQGGDLYKASYGWDPLALRPRTRLLHQRDGQRAAETVARLPADALYSPVPTADGSAYVLASARGQNYLYRVDADGRGAVVASGLSDVPTYGATQMPDGNLLVADWAGRILRVTPWGHVQRYTELPENLYQITADRFGDVYAATYRGAVIRVDSSGVRTEIPTGFGQGRLVAVAAAPEGGVFAAERGGRGRILRLRANGEHEVVAEVPNAHFYGLAADGDFLYALDLYERRVLRISLRPTATPLVATTPEDE